jgi:hypothetical protein
MATMYANKTTRPLIAGSFQVEEIRYYPEEMMLVIAAETGHFSILLGGPGDYAALLWFYRGSNIGKDLGAHSAGSLALFFEELLARPITH